MCQNRHTHTVLRVSDYDTVSTTTRYCEYHHEKLEYHHEILEYHHEKLEYHHEKLEYWAVILKASPRIDFSPL